MRESIMRTNPEHINAADKYLEGMQLLNKIPGLVRAITEEDKQKARKCFQEAASGSHWDAQYEYGICCLEGIGGEKLPKEAINIFRSAAKYHAPSQHFLGELCLIGKIVNKDIKTGLFYLESAANQNYSPSLYSLGCIYFEEGEHQDLQKGLEYLKLAAKQDHTRAQDLLGRCYSEAKKVEKNPKESLKYFEQAAKKNYAPSQYAIGKLYLMGEVGIKKNMKKGFSYIESAANQNYLEARFTLAECYLAGTGVRKNENLAIENMKICSDKGFVEAKFWLGQQHRTGDIIKKDLLMAEKYFSSIINHHPDAKEILAQVRYELGMSHFGPDKDIESLKKALVHFEASANKESESKVAEVRSIIAKNYYEGKKVTKNLALAAENFDVLAKKGDKEAQFYLGEIYLFQLGQAVYINRGLENLKASAAQGFEKAQNLLDTYYFNCAKKTTDLTEAAEFLKNASKYPDPSEGLGLVQCELIKVLINQKDFNRASDVLLHLYEINYPMTKELIIISYNLGLAQHSAANLNSNRQKGVKLFTIAAENQYSDALVRLGSAYSHGEGVEKNLVKAEENYKLAADLKNENGYCALAYIYLERKNREMALQYFLKIPETSPSAVSSAKIITHNLYEVGKDLTGANNEKEKINQGLEYLRLAVTRGHSDAKVYLTNFLCVLALQYAQEPGMENAQEVIQYLKESIKLGNQQAEGMLKMFQCLSNQQPTQNVVAADRFFQPESHSKSHDPSTSKKRPNNFEPDVDESDTKRPRN
jgi:TPR repeat protein